jgi:hydroxyacylglutathione hydrolase
MMANLQASLRARLLNQDTSNDQAHIPQVSVRELKQFLDSRNSAIVLDVRSPVEWESGHIPGAIHIPAGELQKRLNEVDTAAPLYVICGSGYRSSIAASILTRTRRLTPINVNGGMAA